MRKIAFAIAASGLVAVAAASSSTPTPAEPAVTYRNAVAQATQNFDFNVNLGVGFGNSETAFVLGIDAETQVKPSWSAGGFADYSFFDSGIFDVGPYIGYHPVPDVEFIAGPGASISKSDTIFVFRLGAKFKPETRASFSIKPFVWYDFRGHRSALTIGLSVSK